MHMFEFDYIVILSEPIYGIRGQHAKHLFERNVHLFVFITINCEAAYESFIRKKNSAIIILYYNEQCLLQVIFSA